MSPLMLKVMLGAEDNRLLEHIAKMERLQNKVDGGNGISPTEKVLLETCYERLGIITDPLDNQP